MNKYLEQLRRLAYIQSQNTLNTTKYHYEIDTRLLNGKRKYQLGIALNEGGGWVWNTDFMSFKELKQFLAGMNFVYSVKDITGEW